MKGFILRTKDGIVIRFAYYMDEAPITSKGFDALLPFNITLMHARVSGQEIWTDKVPDLDIVQENSSVFTEPGEVVFGPLKPIRSKTKGCMGIYYGEGRGLDACNIFAKVTAEDRALLQSLGESIWKGGVQDVILERIP